ncbi:hypothetical protein [Deinococcus wulumuqiensis]|uniref:hypothetical protein n=1 Tax=Deinococcus wulumuqiensis TaxID=980427 RepID=UPI00242FE34F|nr:hypothetical protein [Deinococcus wulumuqiensis]
MKPNPQEHQKQIDMAVAQFRSWQSAGVNLLDVETTGLDGRVWQLALVDSRTHAPLLVLSCDPGPDCEWSEVAETMQRKQGVYPGDFPPAEAFGGAVWETLEKHALVIWNDTFELGALARTWPLGEGRSLQLTTSCAMRAYAPIYGQWSESKQDWKYASLDAALKHEGVDTSRLPAAHSAYGDCVRLAALIEAVAERETASEQGDRMTREDVALYGDGLVGPE